MFIQLSQLISQAGLSGMHLMIRPLSEGKISITLSTESGNGSVDNPALKSALAQPLHVQGTVTELDETFSTALNDFIESYTEHSVSNNTQEVIQGHASGAEAVAPKTPSTATAKTEGETPKMNADTSDLAETDIITADEPFNF